VRVLFAFSSPYLPDNRGGTHVGTNPVVLALKRRGVPVAMAVRAAAGSPTAHHPTRRDFADMGYSDETMGYTVFRLHRPYADLGRVARAFDATVIITHNLFPLARAAVFAGYPTLLRLHHCELFGLFGQAGPPWYDIAGLPIGYTAVSGFVSEFWQKVLNVRAPVVYSAVDAASYRTPTTREKLLFVNPNPQKGVDITLKLAAARPDIPFEIIESWPLGDAQFAALSAQCATIPNIALLRTVADMRAIYARTKVILVPSRWLEGSARVVTEAQMNGIPVLASHRGGLPEMVGAGGILADPDAPIEQWTKALAMLWDDPAVYARCSQAAVEQAALIGFQPDHVADQLLEIAARQIEAHRRSFSTPWVAAQ